MLNMPTNNYLLTQSSIYQQQQYLMPNIKFNNDNNDSNDENSIAKEEFYDSEQKKDDYNCLNQEN